MNLKRLDLNLLVLFDALYRLRTVQAASSEVAMSSSAFSHALTRLRESLKDELFIRVGNAMTPTGVAEEIAPAVAQALKLLDDGLRSAGGFDPATSERNFVFSATDYTALVLLPALTAHLREVAPGLRLQVRQGSRKVPFESLASGEIDFALGYTEEGSPVPAGVRDFDWFTDRYVVIARRDHPGIVGSLTLDQYLAARHVIVTPWGEARGAIDHELDKVGLARQVAVQLPSVLAAPFIVASTDLLLVAPLRAARLLQGVVPITIHEPPFGVLPYTLKAYCHAKRFNEPAHRWMREAMLQAMDAAPRGYDGRTILNCVP